MQEGAVARKLYFYFSTGAVELESLLDDVEPDLCGRGPKVDVQATSHVSVSLEKLCLLDDDIKAFETSLDNFEDPASSIAKCQLRSILRLGYLSLPRFRSLATLDEGFVFPSVLSSINQAYEEGRKETLGTHRLWKVLQGSVPRK